MYGEVGVTGGAMPSSKLEGESSPRPSKDADRFVKITVFIISLFVLDRTRN